MPWVELETTGQTGSEGGTIVSDFETAGARITLEKGGSSAPYAITCGVYGWMFHTRFFGTPDVACAELELMKEALAEVALLVGAGDGVDGEGKATSLAAIQAFVERYP